jgi:xanthine/uracil/vitamin C permease (AzgA family)
MDIAFGGAGIGGFIGYVVMMLSAKRHKEVHGIMYGLSVLFIIYLVVKFTAL